MKHDLLKLYKNSREAGLENLELHNKLSNFMLEKIFYFTGFFITTLLTFEVFSDKNSTCLIIFSFVFLILSLITGFISMLIEKKFLLNSGKERIDHSIKVMQYIIDQRISQLEQIPDTLQIPENHKIVMRSNLSNYCELIQFCFFVFGLILAVASIVL